MAVVTERRWGENALTGDVHVAGCLCGVHYKLPTFSRYLQRNAHTTKYTGMKRESDTKRI